MAKANIKTLIAEKGERYAVYAAGGIMLLLMIVGIMNMSDQALPSGKGEGETVSPEDYIKGITAETTRINSAINAKAEPVAHTEFNPYGPRVKAGPGNSLFFDPIAPPDSRRINPVVLKLLDIQADFVHAKVLAVDIEDAPDGTQRIGVVVAKAGKGEVFDKDATSKFLKDLAAKGKYKPPPKKRPPATGMFGEPGEGIMGVPPGGMTGTPPMGIMGMPPGGQIGMPPGGQIGMPPGGQIGMPPGGKFGMPPGGMIGGPSPGAPGGMDPGDGYGGVPIETGERLGVEYVPLDPEKLEGKRLALTIYPQRMVIIHAAFPYKKQLKEIQQALRLEKEGEVFNTTDASPYFRGFVIERQILRADGKTVDVPWKLLDVEKNYRETIYPRKFGDKDDEPSLQYVMLHEDHELTLPLPHLLSGKYPDMRVPSILATIEKQKALNKQPALQKLPSQLKGEGNPFKRNQGSSVGVYGQPPTDEPGLMFPKGKFGMGTGMDTGKEGTSQTVLFNEQPDTCLVRIIDNDITPGRLYQYRIRLKMQNPNWVGKKDEKGKPEKAFKYDLVSRPADADVEIIEGPALELDAKHAVRVPREDFLFAVDPPLPEPAPKDSKEPKKPTIVLKPGEGLLQVQRWLPLATIEKYKEPVADWVVADVVVKRGHYVGSKQLVNLPIWDSAYNRYILREAVPEKAAKKDAPPRRGVMMDPTKPGPTFVVVDVRGGVTEERMSTRFITEESANEVLLLDEAGNLQVRSSVIDRADAERGKREAAWKAWIEKTEKDTTSLVPSTNPKGKDNEFEK